MQPSEEMKSHLLQMGLSQREVDGVSGDIVKYIQETSYAKFLAVWNLLPPSRWAFYKAMDYHLLREMVVLSKVERILKHDWRKAYADCKRDSEQKHKESNF